MVVIPSHVLGITDPPPLYHSAHPRQGVVRGIICNWLVTTAIYIAAACSDLASKASIIALIITIFVALGFEHSVVRRSGRIRAHRVLYH